MAYQHGTSPHQKNTSTTVTISSCKLTLWNKLRPQYHLILLELNKAILLSMNPFNYIRCNACNSHTVPIVYQTAYQKLFTKENVHEFHEFWDNYKQFLAVFLKILHV